MNVPKEKAGNTRVSAFLIIPFAILFLAAGGAKLAGAQMLVEQFNSWGYPAWFVIAVGASEVVGALTLVMPFTRLVGAFVLAVVMIGAIATHAMFSEWASALIPLALLIFLGELVRRGVARRSDKELPSGKEIQVTP